MLNVDKIRSAFPILSRQVNCHPLVYLDNAATSQKPQVVIDSLVEYYSMHNANVHRGIHTLGDESTKLYNDARATVARFIGASDPDELVFVRNTTEAINLVAFSWAMKNLEKDDEILVTELEHHSNLIPWQRVCEQTGAKLIHLPVDGNGDLVMDYLISLVHRRTKLVALTEVSNVLGTIIDVKHVAKEIKRSGSPAKILIDGAQSVPHQPVHVQDFHVDFFVFSGHKMCGPQGIGGLWVKKDLLKIMDPFLVGGGMISKVFTHHSEYADLPDRFDAGTPNVAGAVGLATACNYLNSVGMQTIRDHEIELTQYALEQFTIVEEQGMVKLYGLKDPYKRSGIITFTVSGVHAHDVAQVLDREAGVAIRSGHHCNQPLMEKLGVPATCRASFYLYNTKDEIDKLISGLHRTRQVFKLK
jgi:cysteine desulfurase / selenocysteine lyase